MTDTPEPFLRDPVSGTYWPTVDGDVDTNGIEWVLRYGEPTKEQLLRAASIVEAYDVLTTGHNPRESLARARRAVRAAGAAR